MKTKTAFEVFFVLWICAVMLYFSLDFCRYSSLKPVFSFFSRFLPFI
ncbi:MAG: hypothetical protein HZA48_09465 [Planctomycetes bacterium]|nr:hypothetical protein [Planctomycetota bacterium]